MTRVLNVRADRILFVIRFWLNVVIALGISCGPAKTGSVGTDARLLCIVLESTVMIVSSKVVGKR